MSNGLDNAKGLYLEGIQQGRAREAIEKYTGERYTQHSTGVRDGAEGFVEFFESFVERNPVREINIVRGIQDGRFGFLHVEQNLNDGEARWITTDMFEFDADGRVIEHWDVIAPVVEQTVSGRSQIDGPTEIRDEEKTESNKAIVAAFIRDVLDGGRGENASKYVSAKQYHQHNPQVADGLAGLEAFLAQLRESGLSLKYKYVFKILGQGNFVVSYCLVQLGDEDYAVFDIFRLENGVIVEHWDNMEPLPRGDMLVNRGKF